jgi:hypothetical protein
MAMGAEITKEQQLKAMTTGSFMSLLADFVPDPTMVDIRKYISVDREDLRGYLLDHPLAARSVLSRAKCDSVSHDRLCLVSENGKYCLYWLDHGTRRFAQEFETLEAAVAEYLMQEHGLN